MPSVDHLAADVATLGLATSASLREAGISQRTVRRRIGAGHWATPFPGVVDLHRTPWTWERRALLALLACPGGSVLSHASAARLHRLGVEPSLPVHVTVARPVRYVNAPCRLHTSVRPLDAVAFGVLRATTLRRTLLDLAAEGSPRRLHRAARIALGDGRTDVDELTDPALRGRPGARRLRQAAVDEEDHAGRWTDSPAERAWVATLLRHDLRDFVTQHPVTTSDGRSWRLDVAWPLARLALEVDGSRFHRDALSARHDRDRTAALAADGWVVERVGTRDLEPARTRVVVATLRQHLALRNA